LPLTGSSEDRRVCRADHASLDRIARMAPERHKRCLGCGYILDGLPENRCPECGRPFDPNKPTTYVTRIESGRRYLAFALLGITMMAIATTLAQLADRGMFRAIDDWSAVLALPLLLAGACLEFYVLVVSIVALCRPRGTREYPTCWLAALIISGVIVAGLVVLVLSPSYY
jgi:hypothetical protein